MSRLKMLDLVIDTGVFTSSEVIDHSFFKDSLFVNWVE